MDKGQSSLKNSAEKTRYPSIPKTIKLLGKNIGQKLHDMDLAEIS